MLCRFTTRYQAIIGICLLLVLIAIVIHPSFDIPNARAKRGIAAIMFALPVAGLRAFSTMVSGRLLPESIAILSCTTPQFSLPLLC